MDWATHEYLHRTRGAVIASGFAASNYTIANPPSGGSLDSHAKLDIANGVFFDEDLEVSISHAATPAANSWQQKLQGGAYIPMFWMSGSSWTRDPATQFPMKQGTGTVQWNSYSGGTWSAVDMTSGRLGITWIAATNNLNNSDGSSGPIIGIMGQNEYNNIGEAESTTWDELDLVDFPVLEFRPLYKVIYEANTNFGNTPKAKIVSVIDVRSISSNDGFGGSQVSDHGLLTGLLDDDHVQYLNESRHNSLDHSAALSTAVLDDLSDVTITSATPNHFMRYNGSSWVNQLITLGTNTDGNYMSGVSAGTGISVSHTPSEGSTATISLNATLDNLSDVTISNTASLGHVLQYNGSAWVNVVQPANVDVLQVRVFL